MTKTECLDHFKVACMDFWGDRKTPKAIREAWDDLLRAFREEGEKVPEYRLTRDEVRMLMR